MRGFKDGSWKAGSWSLMGIVEVISDFSDRIAVKMPRQFWSFFSNRSN